jgi:hypothetical protein
VTDIVEPICPFINGLIGFTIAVPIYPKPICPFINGQICSTTSVLLSSPFDISVPICPKPK